MPQRWEKYYPKGVRWDCEIPAETLPGLIERSVEKYGERTIIDFRDREMSFNELGERIDAAAAAFLRAGYGKGTSVALFLGNTPDHPVNFFGATKAGARIVHLSPLDGAIALSHKLKDSGARVLVTTNLAPLLAGALKFLEHGLLDTIIVCEEERWGATANPLMPLPKRNEVVSFGQFIDGAQPPAAWPARDAGRRGGAAIYRRHHRHAEGRDADPRQPDGRQRDLRRLGRGLARRARRRDRQGDLLPAAVSYLRADHCAAARYRSRQRHPVAPALRRRSGAARHRGQARDAPFRACPPCGLPSPTRRASRSAISPRCSSQAPAVRRCRSKSRKFSRRRSAWRWAAAGA